MEADAREGVPKKFWLAQAQNDLLLSPQAQDRSNLGKARAELIKEHGHAIAKRQKSFDQLWARKQ